ncbi:MAG: tRNA glutamyl-Q(34) synthetase GluQRS [Planctomyces sp.]|nr:tRNA glutamyl-Q(34) synthetase GluQRS [Planctomyces sp.]
MTPAANDIVGRLAHSPTGAQHVGNARTYLIAWLSARSQGGRLIFRMEDIDSPRVKPWAAQQALDDLRWLGLDWDEGPDCGGPYAPYIQTERLPRYSALLEELRRANAIYPCTCTRSDIESAASAPHAGHEGPIYPGTCAGRSAAEADELSGRPFCWRFRMSFGISEADSAVTFDDLLRGRETCRPAADLGDFVIAKGNGTPAYQLAVVADDHAMGVTEVVRGDDLIPSTFRQLALLRFFGWTAPRYVHLPLVVGPDGRRLAKRHGDTRIALLRERGIPPERLIGRLAHSCGLTDSPAPIAARDLMAEFDVARLNREPWVFTARDWESLAAR